MIPIDDEAQSAVFSSLLPDGNFLPEIADYLREISQTRGSVVLAFAPKAAGTYLRTAAIAAIGGQLVRTVHAQGGRDGQFYLPNFLLYYAGGFPTRPLVTHVHMQALPANRAFITTLDLKPAIMVRSIPDMLVSYLDMLAEDYETPDNWLNLQLPHGFRDLADTRKTDFMIDMLGPWYASYFASWLEWAQDDARVLVLDYDGFRADPLATLESLLHHSRFVLPREACRAALDEVWEERQIFRFRTGLSGRGHARFTEAQLARLRGMLDFYPVLGPWKARLIPPPSASWAPAAQPSAAA